MDMDGEKKEETQEVTLRKKVLISLAVLSVFFLIRAFILAFLVFIGGPDTAYYVDWGADFIENPFSTPRFTFLKEFLFVFPVGLADIFSLDRRLIINFFIFSFDILCTFLVFKIANKFYDFKGSMIVLLAFSLPTTYSYALLEGQDEIIVTFFFALLAYAYLYKKWNTLAVSFSVLVMIFLFPIFLFPLIYKLTEKKKVFLIVVVGCLLFSSLFYLLSPDILVGGSNREIREGHLSFISPYTLLMLKGWYTDIVRYPAFALFLVAVPFLLYYIPRTIKDKEANFLFSLVAFNLLFVIFFPVPYHHYLAWCFPVLLLMMPYKRSIKRFLLLLVPLNITWMASFAINGVYNASWFMSTMGQYPEFLPKVIPYTYPLIGILLIIIYINHYVLFRLSYDYFLDLSNSRNSTDSLDEDGIFCCSDCIIPQG